MIASISTTTLSKGNYINGFSKDRKFKVVSTMESGERVINFHKLLSSSKASVGEIKKAYRKLALQYHPDVCESCMKEASTKLFVELQDAYTSLIDQVSENGYNFDGKRTPEARVSRSKWESQLLELNRRSQDRRFHQDGSWGCRMRARFTRS